jgi:hypothetical protein
MTTCIRCHRPLKRPTESGFGPVCAKVVQPVQEVECDLFGYDVEAAALAARERLSHFIAGRVVLAKYSIRRDFYEARQRMGVRP